MVAGEVLMELLEGIPPWILWPSVFLGIIFTLTYGYITWDYNYWKKRGVPTVKGSFPFGNFGDIFLMRQNSIDFYRKLYDRFEGQRYAGIMAVNEVVFMPRDPELIKSIMAKDFSHFHDRGFPSDENYDPISMNLFSLNGRRWKTLRTKLSPTFSSGKMKAMFPLVRKCAENLPKTIEREMSKYGDQMEFKELFGRYLTDAIASVAFGVEGHSLEDPEAEMRAYGRRIFDPSFPNCLRNTIVMVAPYMCDKLGIHIFDPKAVQFFLKVVHSTVDYREKNGVNRPDFLQLLMTMKKENYEGSMTKAEIEAQCFFFFSAGSETSSSAVSFCIYELAQNLDIQDELRREVDGVLSSHGGEISYESLSEMQLMERVLKETMRIYPPVSVLVRECTKPFVVPPANGNAPNGKPWKQETINGGLAIDTGVRIQVPIIGLHYDSNYFPNPEHFDPSRFTEDAIKSMRYGMLLAKASLASLLSNFEFRPSEKCSKPLVMDKRAFFPISKEGIWVK
ncbi:hypothetical protein J437_LFUL019092, partial [Ladona fulva]